MAIFIPEDKISEIKNATNIVDIVSEAVLLKKAGKNHVGLCPFHSEKTPSFTVSPDKQIFHCFGCSTGGNVFSFLMKQDGLSFPEAARHLAKRFGIDIQDRPLSPAQKKKVSERENLLDINRRAASFYHQALSGIVQFLPTEFQKAELQIKYNEGDFFDSFAEIKIRTVFVIGAHGAHQY